jgi:hypothetical protein
MPLAEVAASTLVHWVSNRNEAITLCEKAYFMMRKNLSMMLREYGRSLGFSLFYYSSFFFKYWLFVLPIRQLLWLDGGTLSVHQKSPVP